MRQDSFDYFSWWRYAVTTLSIAPSEAWNLDYCELSILSESTSKSRQDGSLMVNAQRRINGMLESEVKNVH